MYKIKRILVALDLTSMDKPILTYVSAIVKGMGSQKLYFFHLTNNLEIPEEIKSKYADSKAPPDEIIQQEIEDRVAKHFDSSLSCEFQYEVRVGKSPKEIIHWSDIKIIDLIVLGRKVSMTGTGKLAARIARSSHCSVLIIPEEPPYKLDLVLVPINLENETNLPLEQALEISRNRKQPMKIIIQNIYEVHSGYHYSGKSYEEYAQVMKKNAERAMKKVIKKYDLDDYNVEYSYDLDQESDLAEMIYEVGLKKNVDMILMGSKGRTKTASLFIHSIAEEVTKYDKIIPLFIVKNKDKNLGFIEAIKRL